MLRPRWKKVLRDITSNRTRTLLVIVSITVGIFAVGIVQHINTIITGEMKRVYRESNGAHATIFTDAIDDELIQVVERMPMVEAVQGFAGLSLKVEVAPGQWEPINVDRVPAYTTQQMNKLEAVYQLSGRDQRNAAQTQWSGRDEIMLERSSLNAAQALPAGLAVGDLLQVEDNDGRVRTLTVAGLVYDANTMPVSFTGTAAGYVDEETFERLGGATTYSELAIRVRGTPEQILDIDYVRNAAEEVAAKIEKSGRTVRRIQVFRPGRLPLQDIFDALSWILTPLGILALILGSFLVSNTMSALIAQQTRQIGVMKAVGADLGQIVRMYLGAVVVYGLSALLIAIPLTIGLATLLELVLGGFINLSVPLFAVPTNVLFLQIGIGVLIPLVAALYPILRGAAVTVREAISDYGVGNSNFGASWLDRLITRIRFLSRPMQISLRNTFRRRGRLVLTLITLVMGGMIFMTVGSVRLSLEGRVEQVLTYNQFDIQVQLGRAYRAEKIEQIIRQTPGIDVVEGWDSGQAVRIRPDKSESDTISLNALPPASQMIAPTLVSGRWLVADDQNAIVLAQSITTDEADIRLGDAITLRIDEKDYTWIVVGFAETTEFGGAISAYVNYDYYTRLTNNVGKVRSVCITLTPDAPGDISTMLETLTGGLEQANIQVGFTNTVARIRTLTGNVFTIIIVLLMVMGALIAAVGAIGLSGTMSTNVLERTREIGVMRAMGASDGAVLRIVMVEGVLIGAISWIIGALLAYPTGYLLSVAIGLALFQTPLPYFFSSDGVLQWLGVVVGLAMLASYLPARNASRMTVRETLAYE
jgi:putative ABC transport system permease protein